MKRLSDTAGAGNKIMDNWRLFRHEIDPTKSEGDFFVYKVVFGNQEGHLNFRVENGEIRDVNLYVTGFSKTLGSHNDASLIRVAEMVYR
ncbi:hypothetical protein ACQCVK_21910 [Rossellomorea vietnamensis]|uniref:hypothetical protein n=1 Tax=Rossellomorea vietnamensis TaxID=218284 RepID=UPI003CEEE8A0